MRLTALAGWLLCLTVPLAAALPAESAPRSLTLAGQAVGDITVLAPENDPKLFVELISDKDGLTAENRAQAERLVARGAAVALVDLPTLISREAASEDTECHYIYGDLDDLAHNAEHELGMTNWRWPVLFGIGGGGGGFAYLVLGQTPLNTAAGSVSLGFEPTLPTKLPLCGDNLANDPAKSKFTYGPANALPGRWRWIASAPPPPNLAEFVKASGSARLQIVGGDAKAQLDAALDAVFEIGSPPETALDLPLVELPAKQKAKALAVFISGDGGWRDIDKKIGDYLADQNVAVVGVDSLRYFWRHKSPEQIAADLDRIVDYYQRRWQVRATALLGYSFGADVLPLAWGKLSPATREATQVIGLVGFEPTADLEVSISGWLGLESSQAVAVRPYLASMPASKVLCVFGLDEERDHETACTFPELAGATKLNRPGGHHFDGNYQTIADAILAKLEHRTLSSLAQQ